MFYTKLKHAHYYYHMLWRQAKRDFFDFFLKEGQKTTNLAQSSRQKKSRKDTKNYFVSRISYLDPNGVWP